jgi:hypothetical protein
MEKSKKRMKKRTKIVLSALLGAILIGASVYVGNTTIFIEDRNYVPAKDTSKDFRFALSVGAFSVRAFECDISYQAGTMSASNLKELQQIYIEAGSTEMFARIATKRESLENGLALARLAAELNQPFNPEIMCAYEYMDMDKQEAPNFEEYPEFYALQNGKAWEELSLEEICLVLKSYGRLVATEILSTGCTVQNWNLGNEANFGFAGISLGLKTAVNPELEKVSKIAGYMASVVTPDWLSKNVWQYTAKAKAALAEGIRLGYADLGIDSSDVVFSTHIATVVTTVTGTVKFFKTMQENGFDLGVAGISYYPSAPCPYLNTMTMYKKLITSTNKECGLPVFIAEYAYPTGAITGSYSGWKNQVPGYPISEDGQDALLRDVVEWGKSKGLVGIRYWVPDFSHSTWASMSMFNYDNATNTATAKTILTNLLGNNGL